MDPTPARDAARTGDRPRVLLVTMRLLPQGEIGGAALTAALAELGVEASWVCWDDDTVDWACDLIVVRSTWDYHRRLAEFVAWARRVERISPLLNGADTFEWNADKAYLLDLAPHLPVVETTLLDESGLVEGLRAGLAAHDEVVLKPRVGAGGNGVVVAAEIADERLAGLSAGPWVLQPLVTSVRTTGETSVYVFGGRASSQVDKQPGAGEVRVHGHHGGRSRAVALGSETAALSEQAIAVAGRLLGGEPAYARVDMMVVDDHWALSELELIEPGLYLDVQFANAGRFAELVRDSVGSPTS